MNTLPLQFLMRLFAGWANRQQQDGIEYLQEENREEENRALRDQLGGKRLRFTDQQRSRLAVKAKAVGRKGLLELDTRVTPDTQLRWHRQLIARTVKLPARSPNLNAYAERFVRSIKSECLAQIIPLGERHLRHAVKEAREHYKIERNHQGLGNRLIEERHVVVDTNSAIVRHGRLGGILDDCNRRAAWTVGRVSAPNGIGETSGGSGGSGPCARPPSTERTIGARTHKKRGDRADWPSGRCRLMDTFSSSDPMPGERDGMLMTSFRAARFPTARYPAALLSALLGLLTSVLVAAAAEPEEAAPKTAREAHLALLQEDRFPSAGSCRTCHPEHYRQWSASPHAYAQMSVVFQSMHAAVVTLTNGTNGDFCIRCHTPVGMNLGEPPVMSNEDRHPTSREGITCISCHRVAENYQRISGRFPIVEAPLCEPVYGPSGNDEGLNEEVARVLADPSIRVAGCGEAGRTIHQTSEQRVFLTESGFCGACHDVRLVNGFRLEDAFSEYKTSPAALNGVSCQDCHMGKVPGVNGGYDEGPAAVVGGVPTKPRKVTNHMFAGPDYSIIHPALFPANPKTAKLATISEWVEFDYEGGWGDDAFEEKAFDEGMEFPAVWRSVGKRRRARALIDKNCEVLDSVEAVRLEVLQAGFRLGELKVDEAGDDGISFEVQVYNGTDGHGVPTGFDAERVIFLSVVVRDKSGKQVFASGDRDPNGDLRDLHSIYVHNGEVPLDPYLFSLQSKFLTRNIRGTEREQVLPINFSLDPLPFLRPEARPTSLYGRPRGARKHKQVILPGDDRWPAYEVDASTLRELGAEGPYTAEIELIGQMIPVNLIGEISFMGFEYGMSPRKIADNVVAGAQVLWRREVTLASGQHITEEADRGQPAGALQCRNIERTAAN